MHIVICGYCQDVNSLQFKVIDADSGVGIAYSHISLLDSLNIVIKETNTNADGFCTWNVKIDLRRVYIVQVTAVGFESQTLSVNQSLKVNGLLTVKLTKSTVALNEVTVFDKQITRDGSKMTYRVKHDQFSSATNTSSLLNRIPGVSVISGDAKVNNRNGVLILIDGKGELRSSTDQLALLSTLNADQIEKIEVNPFPESKYDASVNAVINVITKKEKDISNAELSLSSPIYRNPKVFGTEYFSQRLSSGLNFKIQSWKVSLLMDISNTRYPENSISQTNITNVTRYNSEVNANYSVFSVNPELVLDRDLSRRSSISFDLDFNLTPHFHRDQFERYNFFNPVNNSLDSSSIILNDYYLKKRAFEVTGSYKYVLNEKKKSNLYINVIYSNNHSKLNNELNQQQLTSGDDDFLSNIANASTDIVNASAIISGLLKEKFLNTEFGIKTNILNSDSKQLLNSFVNNFRYEEQISSAFFNASWTFGSYQVVTDIRTEFLHAKTRFINQTEQNRVQDYLRIYPRLLIQKNFTDEVFINLGYIRRIRRPFINFLNPSLTINSFYNSLSGNIYNIPAYYDRLESQFVYKDFFASAYSERISNQMFFRPSAGNQFIYENGNLGNLYRTGITLTKEFKAAKWFASNLSVDLANTRKANDDVNYYKNDWTTFNLSGSATFTISEISRVQVDLYYSPKSYRAFNLDGSQTFITASLRQVLSKDRLTMDLSVIDPLGMQKNRTDEFYEQRSGSSRETTNNRLVSFKLIYSFPFGNKFQNQLYKKKNDGEIRN